MVEAQWGTTHTVSIWPSEKIPLFMGRVVIAVIKTVNTVETYMPNRVRLFIYLVAAPSTDSLPGSSSMNWTPHWAR